MNPKSSDDIINDGISGYAVCVNDPFLQQQALSPQGLSVGLSDLLADPSYADKEEACLIRHFIDELASWFDITGTSRYFEITVPQRATICSILNHAILAASAAHIVRLSHCRGELGVVELAGIQLPYLSMDTAFHHYSTCISHLKEMLDDSPNPHYENLIATIAILRFYEQIGGEAVSGTKSSVVQAVIHSGNHDFLHTYQTVQRSPREHDTNLVLPESPNHSTFLITPQQEVWAAFFTQETSSLPHFPANEHGMLDVADGFERTHRRLIWCIDLLKFCFTESKSMTHSKRIQRWKGLKEIDPKWEASKPEAFSPLYFQESEPLSKRHFPVMWYRNTHEILEVQYVLLTRILLAVSNPSLCRLGITARSECLALEDELRHILRQLVGLALSNQKCPAVSINAAVGISVCGGYLTNPDEQDAIAEFMKDLKFGRAWPTSTTVAALTEAWSNNISADDLVV